MGNTIAFLAFAYFIGIIVAIAILEFGRSESQPDTGFLKMVRDTLANTFLAQGLVAVILPSIYYAVRMKLCSLTVPGYIVDTKIVRPADAPKGLAGLDIPKATYKLTYNYYHNGRMFTRKTKIKLEAEPEEGSTLNVRINPLMPSMIYDGNSETQAWIIYLIIGAVFIALFFAVKYDLFNWLSQYIPDIDYSDG